MISIIFLFVLLRWLNLFASIVDGDTAPDSNTDLLYISWNIPWNNDWSYDQVEMMYDSICDTSTQYCEPSLAE